MRPCRLINLSKNVLHVYRLYLAPIIDQIYNPKLQLWKNVQGRSCHSAANQKVSKSSSRVGAVEESNSSGACDFTGENTFRCEVLYFPVYCVRPCIASYVIGMPVAKLGLAPPAFCETLPLCNGRDPVFCEALPFCETLCEILPSVRPWLL